MRRTRRIGLVIAISAVATGCRETPVETSGAAVAADPSSWFEDITELSGVRFVHQVTTSGNYLFSETMGSGGAFFDFNNDGRLDIYLIHNVASSEIATNRLFRQEPGGRFTDVTAGSGLDVAGFGNGVAVGDVNNDGWPEVLITEYDRVRLFLNDGNGRFKDVTAATGITNQHWSVPAAFFDYDRDGWLDLVIGNYLDFDPSQKCFDAKGQPEFCGPHGFRPTITRLLRNLGPDEPAGLSRLGRAVDQRGGLPRFEDRTVEAGFARVPGKAMQILCADFDGDHWPDVFITDDALPNRLFVNQRNGTFKEEAIQRGIGYTGTGGAAANMGIAIGDADNDGLWDVFVPHLAQENHTLWRQIRRGIFDDHTARAGLLNVPWHGTGFSAVFADFDCDGAVDLAIANGAVRRPIRGSSIDNVPFRVAADIMPFWTAYAQPAQLFANDGTGRFREISDGNPELCGEAVVGRGLLCGDVDNDGGPDALIIGIGGRAGLYRNRASPRGHWLGVRAVLPDLGHRDAYGAEVVVQAGDQRWWRLIQPAYGYASSNDPRVHFGIGTTAEFDAIHVRWPDGALERFSGGPANRYVTLRQGEGRRVVE